jgi:hypothetical protein
LTVAAFKYLKTCFVEEGLNSKLLGRKTTSKSGRTYRLSKPSREWNTLFCWRVNSLPLDMYKQRTEAVLRDYARKGKWRG